MHNADVVINTVMELMIAHMAVKGWKCDSTPDYSDNTIIARLRFYNGDVDDKNFQFVAMTFIYETIYIKLSGDTTKWVNLELSDPELFDKLDQSLSGLSGSLFDAMD